MNVLSLSKNKTMSKQETLERLEKYQKLYDNLSESIDKLLRFEDEFKEFSDELYRLQAYYHDNWMSDIDAIKDDESAVKFSITSQDAIWNLLSEHYEYNKRLLKVLADELNN